MPKFLIGLTALGLALSACTPQSQPAGSTNNTNEPPASMPEAMADDEDILQADAEVNWLTFANRAAGYSVDYPEKWYWQHYIASQISTAGIEDYFIADPNLLLGLQSEYLGRYVIEISDRSAEEYINDFKSGSDQVTATPKTVDGLEAQRIRGEGRPDTLLAGWTTIFYIFEKDGKTYRLLYTMIESTPEQETQFDAFVRRFVFDPAA